MVCVQAEGEQSGPDGDSAEEYQGWLVRLSRGSGQHAVGKRTPESRSVDRLECLQHSHGTARGLRIRPHVTPDPGDRQRGGGPPGCRGIALGKSRQPMLPRWNALRKTISRGVHAPHMRATRYEAGPSAGLVKFRLTTVRPGEPPRRGLDAPRFRSSARSWMADSGEVEVAEACHSHLPSSRVVQAYQRSDFLDCRAEVLGARPLQHTPSSLRPSAQSPRPDT